MTSQHIRQSFLDFFKSKQHTIVPSSSLMPDSPNLLFTNAGMNQFVPIFLGQTQCPYTPGRAADTQKCIRAGGKHNDLEDVGLDTYHHTFFEMLGNWSFGDYFKREAIEWAWELVVGKWKFPPARLYATVFCPYLGEPGWEKKWAIELEQVLALTLTSRTFIAPDPNASPFEVSDQEAALYWARQFIAAQLDPKAHIIPGNKKDNFWMMGETGPCGPCSELHVDLTPTGNTNGALVNKGSAECIEIWNLVFIQFNANPDGTFAPLPAKHVDTGMGFERVTSIIQGTKGLTDFTNARISNYETDIFRPIFDELERLCGKKYGSTLPGCGTFGGAHAPSRVPDRALAGGTDALPALVISGTADTKYSRRNLPHFERPWAKYMVTFTTRERRQLTSPERDLVLKSVLHAHEHRQYQLYAACVMPDHVHLLFEPQVKQQDEAGNPVFWSVSEILQGIKSASAHNINKAIGATGHVWEKESVDRIIRGQSDLEEKFHYICRNPWDAGVVERTENYPWLWIPNSSETKEKSSVSAVDEASTAAREARALPGNEVAGDTEQEKIDIAFRVIADHIRTLGFAIADGIQPGNTDRNYVLRRILRRAVRYGRSLGFREPFFYKLVDVLADTMGDVFPEIRERKKNVQDVIRVEEEAFNKTLDKGIALFEEEVNKLLERHDRQISGAFAFKLYDEQGFPLDLTELMARERGLTVDTAGFEKLMEEQRARARAAQKKEVIALSQIETTTPTHFLGYEHAHIGADVQEVVTLKNKTAVVLNNSVCYAEMGGQVGDTGELADEHHVWRVTNTQKSGDTWLHFIAGTEAPQVGQHLTVRFDSARRSAIQRHHTVTHLLHWALHEVVSKEATQKGSFVGPDKLTFDFNSAPLTPAQVADVEKLVNERILENAGVSWTEVPFAEVKSRPDVMHLFGEKYGDMVRVVQIGGQPEKLDGYSMELCGGTHTRATGEIGLFRIVSENAIAAGVRRIEAVAGLEAYQKATDEVALIQSLASKINSPVHELEKKLEALLEQQKALERQVKALQQREAAGAAQALLDKATRINGIPAIIERFDAEGQSLQDIVNELKGRFEGVILLGGAAHDAVALVAAVSPSFTGRVSAGKLIQQIAPIVGGKGGGKPDSARGGGKAVDKLDEALKQARTRLAGEPVSG